MRSFLATLERVRRWLDRAESALLLLLLTLLLSLSFVQVLLRLGHGGLPWADVLARHLVLWLGMAGMALAAARNRHIRIDVLGRVLPERAGRLVGMGLDALAAWICLRLGRAALSFMEQSRDFGDLVDPVAWPAWSWLGGLAGQPWKAWPLQAVIPLAFALTALHFVLNLPLRWTDPLHAESLPEEEAR